MLTADVNLGRRPLGHGAAEIIRPPGAPTAGIGCHRSKSMPLAASCVTVGLPESNNATRAIAASRGINEGQGNGYL
jgi:hypothetical protein